MDTIGLTTLVAYVDGELDAGDAAAVEQHLKADAEAREVVRKLRQSALLVRSAHDPILAEPVPAALVETVLKAPAGAARTASVAPHRPGVLRDLTVPRVAAMIAVLAIGLGGGFGAASYSDRRAQQDASLAQQAFRAQIAATRDKALETARSGVPVNWTSPDGVKGARVLPVRTYYSADNGYCREYQRVTSTPSDTVVVHGVACRTADGEWRPRYELVRDAAIEAVSPW